MRTKPDYLKGAVSLVALLFTFGAASANVLSFDDCVHEAMQSNPDLRVQESVLRALEYQVRGSHSNFFPQLSAGMNINYGNSSRSVANTTITTGASPSWSFSPSASATLNLFSGFADVARVELAKANLASAQADLATLKARISSDLKTAYAALVFAQDSLQLSESINERRNENYRLVSLLFESGRENYGSVLLAKANLEQSEFLIAQAHRAIDTASIQLSRIIGRDPEVTLRVKGKAPLAIIIDNPDFDAIALTVPSYLKNLAQETIALAQQKSNRAPFFPNLDAVSSLGLSDNGNSTSSQWSVGLSVSWSFFNGGRDYYAFKRASQDITTAQRTLAATRVSNISQLVTTYASYKDMQRQIKVDQSFVEALSTQRKIAREEYSNGLLNFFNWDQLETGYITRQQTLLNNERNLVNSSAAWELAQGIGVIP